MELSFSELRAKEVINTQDGRRLGKISDVVLCYPENRWLGVVVPDGRGFAFRKNSLFIDLRNIVKIGEDVVLVDVGISHSHKDCKGGEHPSTCSPCHKKNRNFEEYE